MCATQPMHIRMYTLIIPAHMDVCLSSAKASGSLRARALSKAFQTGRFTHICSLGQKERTELAGLNRWFCSFAHCCRPVPCHSHCFWHMLHYCNFRFLSLFTHPLGWLPQQSERSEQQPPDMHGLQLPHIPRHFEANVHIMHS